MGVNNMQMVINIPEKLNNRLRSHLGHGYCIPNEDVKIIAKAIYNGQTTHMCNIQEALDVLEIYKRNMIHILGDHDEKVKVIETCQMLISELEESKDN